MADSHSVSISKYVEELRASGFKPADYLAVAVHGDVGVGLAYQSATPSTSSTVLSTVIAIADATPHAVIRKLEQEVRPRWVWWDRSTSDTLAANNIIVDRCWDILTVHRLLNGGWEPSVAAAWAQLHDLPIETLPKMGQLGLLDAPSNEGEDRGQPTRPDGHLRPEWIHSRWHQSPEHLGRWASLALHAADLQLNELNNRPLPDRIRSTAHAESAAELLCAELAFQGLPADETEAIRIIEEAAGPRPRNFDEEERTRAGRDKLVTDCLEVPRAVNLRNPAEVKAMLRSVGLDLADTRAWRLEAARDEHPVVEALLTWRKSERVATTYGYRWLDENVAAGRLRGEWSSSDGAAGRMTASAGLHNLPAEMRSAVAADPGSVFVRADLGQIEPRVLAAVSGDPALISATSDDDLYQPVAKALQVDRSIAKLAVLGAMYGSTTGESAHALRRLHKRYPVAMALLDQAAADGAAGKDVFTVGGRRIKMSVRPAGDDDIDGVQSAAAARGRYARNAVIQGAAAEFFKVWAVIVRQRSRPLDGRIVLCLHDELLVHVRAEHAVATAQIVADAVAEAAHYWSPAADVRFVAEVSTIQRWSEAKE